MYYYHIPCTIFLLLPMHYYLVDTCCIIIISPGLSRVFPATAGLVYHHCWFYLRHRSDFDRQYYARLEPLYRKHDLAKTFANQ